MKLIIVGLTALESNYVAFAFVVVYCIGVFAHYLPHSSNNCMVHTEICLIGWRKRQWDTPLNILCRMSLLDLNFDKLLCRLRYLQFISHHTKNRIINLMEMSHWSLQILFLMFFMDNSIFYICYLFSYHLQTSSCCSNLIILGENNLIFTKIIFLY